MKAKIVRDGEGRFYGVNFKCPGCLFSNGEPMHHAVTVPAPEGEEQSPDAIGKPMWGWNGSLDSPTFTPSINTWYEDGTGRVTYRCHSFVADGHIQFLGDCSHKLKGQTVELPDIMDEDA